jgi:hypothetical protein
LNPQQQPNKLPNKRYALFLIIGAIIGISSIKLFTYSTAENLEDTALEQAFRDEYKVLPVRIPGALDFCGEPVPLDQPDVYERLDRELTINTYWQSQTLLNIKKANKWFPIIEPILEEEGVPEDFKYLALIESGLSDVVSPAGAAGFWQILKTTAQEGGMRVDNEIDERYHLEKATRFACSYFKTAKQKSGTWTAAAAAYNMGMNGYSRQTDLQKNSDYYELHLNSETSRYVFRILAAKLIVSQPEKYGFVLRKKDLYAPPQLIWVPIQNPIPNLSEYALELGVNYKILRLHNPWIRANSLTLKAGDTLNISLPEGGGQEGTANRD